MQPLESPRWPSVPTDVSGWTKAPLFSVGTEWKAIRAPVRFP